MLRVEAEPWVPKPVNKKADDSTTRMSKGGEKRVQEMKKKNGSRPTKK